LQKRVKWMDIFTQRRADVLLFFNLLFLKPILHLLCMLINN